MSNTTEQKILDAALKVFASKGYAGARTRVIAEKSGFTEMTLFRKFETKENLFNQVLTVNHQKIMEKVNSLVSLEDEITYPKTQFRALIFNLVDLIDENFDYVNIILYERDRTSRSITKDFISHLGDYLNKFPQDKIDSSVLAYMILSFLYFLILNKESKDAILNMEEALEEFITYHSNALEL